MNRSVHANSTIRTVVTAVKICTLAAAILLLPSSNCRADMLLFGDTFDTENGGNAQFSYTNFAQWNVTFGDVDLIGNNGLGEFYPGHGLYVDLDGSPGRGRMETKTVIDLPPGLYRLSFEIGNNPIFGTIVQANHARVSVADVFSEDFTRVGETPLDTVTRLFTVDTATNGRLVLESLDPSDFAGVVIDDVRLEFVPEPSCVALVTIGFSFVILRRRCSRAASFTSRFAS